MVLGRYFKFILYYEVSCGVRGGRFWRRGIGFGRLVGFFVGAVVGRRGGTCLVMFVIFDLILFLLFLWVN